RSTVTAPRCRRCSADCCRWMATHRAWRPASQAGCRRCPPPRMPGSTKPGAGPGFAWCNASWSGNSGREYREAGVEGRRRTHGGAGLGQVGVVIATDVDRLALGAVELGDDRRLVLGQGLGQRRELRLQRLVLLLRGQRLRPVQGQVEVAAAVVQLADLARRRTVVVQYQAVGLVQ